MTDNARCRWDTTSDPSNPGWVVDYRGETYPPPPGYAEIGRDAYASGEDLTEMKQATLAWEGVQP